MKHFFVLLCVTILLASACDTPSQQIEENIATDEVCAHCADRGEYNYIPDSLDALSPYDGTELLSFESVNGELLEFKSFGLQRDTSSREAPRDCEHCKRATMDFVVESEKVRFMNLANKWDLHVDTRHDKLNCWLGIKSEFWIGGYYDGSQAHGSNQPLYVERLFHPTINLNGNSFSNVTAYVDTLSNKALYFTETQGFVGFLAPDGSGELYTLKQ